jgi:ABC-type polysaccharide/polyol phosphate transport system ATPase subunit
MSEDVVIKVDHLWKCYGLPPSPDFKGVLKNIKNGRPLFYAPNDSGPWSLSDVNFEIKKGEVLGVIGRNGAGKSTLLKVLAGVSPATRGSIAVKGRVFPMIELAAGMHLDLTGRENVRLLGAVMGIPYFEMEANVPKIEEFCELGEWFDRPVYQYSSGMAARLGFAVAMHVNADVLLIDEVLSVGDFLFQKKDVTNRRCKIIVRIRR